MPGVLSGLRAIDLSSGIAGPMVGMLLADHGAEVIRIDQADDPYADSLGYRVWQRGKLRAAMSLPGDRDAVLRLIASADILVENAGDDLARLLGCDSATLRAANTRLIHCSITGYGGGAREAGHAAYDALVAARVGLQWEQRGWPEGAINHMVGRPDPFADMEIPYDWVQGPAREGPLFSASHWPSLGAFFLALTGISAALFAREKTGRGQRVETSLMQGAMAGASGVWQRMDNPDAEGFDTWILSSRSPKGHFECSDGRWVHNWVPNPRFILQASSGATLNATPDLTVQNDPDRFGVGPEELLVMAHYQPILAEAVKKFPCDDWVNAAAVAEMTMQEARPVEVALADPIMLADGCVVELQDPDLGPVRQVGVTYTLSACPAPVTQAAARAGAHTAQVAALAASLPSFAPRAGADAAPAQGGPLAGVRVLDLGLAIAGPFGTQQLADLGADVIKVNALWDMYWHRTHIAYMANRGKRSISLNLKDPRAQKILLDLVKTADVVQHNMRYDAAERLGVDYESLKKIKPDLIYCHTRGHERGPRQHLPGNDQTGACLAGVQHEDGAMHAGGKPLWSLTSFGDTGNGYLSAVGILQALYHRARTGQGQFVDTAIVNACLLNTSFAMARPDGSGFDRPRLDAQQLGTAAGNRLYAARDGWICVVALRPAEWAALAGLAGSDWPARVPGPAMHYPADSDIGQALAAHFAALSVEQALAECARAGVPAEFSDPDFSRRLFDDAELKQRQWTAEYNHAFVGKLEQIGLLYSLSETPGVIQSAPLIVGDHTDAILAELGHDQAAIDAFLAERVVAVFPPRAAQTEMKSPWDAGKSSIPAAKTS